MQSCLKKYIISTQVTHEKFFTTHMYARHKWYYYIPKLYYYAPNICVPSTILYKWKCSQEKECSTFPFIPAIITLYTPILVAHRAANLMVGMPAREFHEDVIGCFFNELFPTYLYCPTVQVVLDVHWNHATHVTCHWNHVNRKDHSWHGRRAWSRRVTI